MPNANSSGNLLPWIIVARSAPSINDIEMNFTLPTLPEIVDADHVLVGDLTRDGEFALESRVGVGVGGELRSYHFQGDRLTELLIPRLVHMHPCRLIQAGR